MSLWPSSESYCPVSFLFYFNCWARVFLNFLVFPLSIRSSIESEPALVLGPLRSLEEQRQEQQLQEIEVRRQERERRAAEEDGGAKDDSPPIQEKADELTGPFHYEFSYWARSVFSLMFGW